MSKFGQMTKDPLAKGPVTGNPVSEGWYHQWEKDEHEALARIFHELLWRDHEDGCAS